MGLVEFLKKAILSISFVVAGILSFAAGNPWVLDGAGFGSSNFLRTLFDRSSIRDQLIQEVEANAAADHWKLIERLAVSGPIDPLPYEAALANAISRGDKTAADGLARQALKLQPRSLSARLYFLNAAVERADYDAVLAQYERLVEIKSLNDDLLADAIIGVFRISGEWGPLLGYVNAQPMTGELLVARLMDEKILPSKLEPVLCFYPKLQSRYLNKLVGEGAYQQAYGAWRLFSNLTDRQIDIPFNGFFIQSSEPPPFNWKINSARADFQEKGGIYVTYSGIGSPLIMNQILNARAGSYILKTEAKGRAPENGGMLEWRLNCLESGAELLQFSIRLNRISEREVIETKVVIPESECNFQKIELFGKPGEFPKTSKVEILAVSLHGETE